MFPLSVLWYAYPQGVEIFLSLDSKLFLLDLVINRNDQNIRMVFTHTIAKNVYHNKDIDRPR